MLGAVVKRARLDAGWSQETLALRLHKTKSWVSKLENDSFAPSYEALCTLLVVLPIDPRWLFPPRQDTGS